MSIATVRLGELMPSKKRSIDPRKSPDQEFELYSIPAFDADGPEVVSGRDVGSSKQSLEKGDVLLSRIVPHIRRAWVVEPPSSRETIGSSEWIIFRSDRFVPAYLRHALVTDRFHQSLMQTVAGVGGSLLRARPSYVADIEIPLPPLEEQTRIAAVLDAADALRAKRRQAIAKLDSLTQAIFIDMFGDPVTNPLEWRDDRVLADVAEVRSGITKGRRTGSAPLTSVPYLAVVNVQDGHMQLDPLKSIDATAAEIEKYAVYRGDILLTEGGDPDKLGRGAVWHGQVEPCIHQNHVFRVRLAADSMTPEFLSHLLASQRGKRYFLRMAKQTTGIASINMTQLRAFPLLEPPRAPQDEFLSRISSVQAARALADRSADQLDTLFASLQQRAFRGEL